jgi:PAS domain S-box-containing protein
LSDFTSDNPEGTLYVYNEEASQQVNPIGKVPPSEGIQLWAAKELLRQSDETILKVDADLCLTMVYNGSTLPFQRELAEGESLRAVLDAQACRKLTTAMQNGKVRTMKYTLKKQHHVYWLRVRIQPNGSQAILFVRDITQAEQNRLEQKKLSLINEKAQNKILRNLEWSEHTHKALIEALPDAIVIVNAKLEIKKLLNADRMEGLLGNVGAQRKANLRNLPADTAAIDSLIVSVENVTQSRQETAELVLPFQDRYLEVHVSGLLGGDAMMLLRDVTNKVLAEHMLQTTLQELSMIKDALDQSSAVLSWLPDGRIIRVNDTIQKLTGFTEKALKQMSVSELCEEVFSGSTDTAPWSQGKLERLELRVKCAAGGFRWLDATFIPILSVQGVVTEFVLIGYDITLKHFAEQELVAQKQLMETVINAAPNLLCLTDRSSRFRLVSKSFCSLLELEADEIVGCTTGELEHLTTSKAGKACLEYLKEWPAVDTRKELSIPGTDGGEYWLDVLYKPMLTTVGEEQLLWVASNISDRKRAMHSLMMKNVELSEAIQMLEKINAELDKFVYSASHNLRAPLTSILGLISLMRIDGQDSQYLQLMEQSIRRLDGFITDIISYSKNARQEVEYAPVAFEPLLRNVFADLAFFNARPSIRIEISVTEDGTFCSDVKRLEMVLSNLISNAFKYHNYMQQDPYIHANVVVSPSEAAITIQDNGQGIASEHIDKIFKMFYRAAESSDGSGIGLYIVKEVVQKLGGTIEVRSELGKGTTFSLRIPGAKVLQV